MRVVLASVGTRGDIQPMAALAQALVCRGHEALIACPATFGPWITSLGLEHQPLGEDLTAKMQESGGKLERSLAGMKQYFTEQMLAQAPALLQMSEGADVILGTGMAWMAPSVAEKLGIPAFVLFPSTCVPSRLHPPPLMPWYGLPRWVNGLLWWLNDRIQDSLMGKPWGAGRAALGLPAKPSFTRHLFDEVPGVFAADEALLPPDPAWQGRTPYTGFLFLDDPTPLDEALSAFLDAGPPPICVGFGSMAGGGPERVGALLEQAIPETERCVVIAGSAKLFGDRPVPARFFVAKSAPFGRLFPRCAVVVHHGGSGTTAIAARAGVPQVVTPVMLDQFHHAHHVVRAGLGPKAPKITQVTATSLRAALDAARAIPDAPRRAMAERLQRSDASAAFVALLEKATSSPSGGAAARSR